MIFPRYALPSAAQTPATAGMISHAAAAHAHALALRLRCRLAATVDTGVYAAVDRRGGGARLPANWRCKNLNATRAAGVCALVTVRLVAVVAILRAARPDAHTPRVRAIAAIDTSHIPSAVRSILVVCLERPMPIPLAKSAANTQTRDDANRVARLKNCGRCRVISRGDEIESATRINKDLQVPIIPSARRGCHHHAQRRLREVWR